MHQIKQGEAAPHSPSSLSATASGSGSGSDIEISMGSIQQSSEPTIEDTFALRPVTKRGGERIPSFRRVNNNVSTLGHIPCSSGSRPCEDVNTTAPVLESPSSLSIEDGFVRAQIPGGIDALLPDSSIQGVVDGAPGNNLVEQIIAAKCPRNLSATVGRAGERRESNFDHGNMRRFVMCFKGRVKA